MVICFLTLTGCGWLLGPNQQQVGQAEIKNFETRTVDAKFDDVYAAATEALFDLGYQIKHSEKASGIIVGEQEHNYTESVYLGKGIWDRRDKQTVYDITLLIRPEDKKHTNVRIKTSVNGEPKLNKDAIDKVWVYVDRQVLMESPPAAKQKHKVSSMKKPSS